MRLAVARIRQLTPAIKSFELRRPEGGDLPQFTAGAHVDVGVVLPDGGRAKRSYSIASAPAERDRWEIGVLRETAGSGGSAFMHDRVSLGQSLEVEGPSNDFPLAPDAAEHLLIAGGIGITPILAMARVLAASGACFQLHYCARSPAEMAWREEAAALGATLHFDGGDPSRGLDLAAVLRSPIPGRHVHVCGPKGMNNAVIELCREAGWPAAQVHFEFFTAAAAEAGDHAIEVELRRSGRIVTVPKDMTILDALIAAGLDPLFDCRRGECGVCTTPVLEGMPLHRDYNLTAAEKASGKMMCICISRATTARLVLDL